MMYPAQKEWRCRDRRAGRPGDLVPSLRGKSVQPIEPAYRRYSTIYGTMTGLEENGRQLKNSSSPCMAEWHE